MAKRLSRDHRSWLIRTVLYVVVIFFASIDQVVAQIGDNVERTGRTFTRFVDDQELRASLDTLSTQITELAERIELLKERAENFTERRATIIADIERLIPPACALSAKHQWADGYSCVDDLTSGEAAGSSAPPVQGSCALPWGGSVAHGQNVTAFERSSIACGQTCRSQTRTCSNGTLTGSYDNQSCAAPECTSSCTLPWGGAINHGQRVTAFNASSVGCDESCEREARICTNGVLSGTFTHRSCSAQTATCGQENKPCGQGYVYSSDFSAVIVMVPGTGEDTGQMVPVKTGQWVLPSARPSMGSPYDRPACMWPTPATMPHGEKTVIDHQRIGGMRGSIEVQCQDGTVKVTNYTEECEVADESAGGSF